MANSGTRGDWPSPAIRSCGEYGTRIRQWLSVRVESDRGSLKIASMKNHMCPRRKPNRKGRPNVDGFNGPFIFPRDGNGSADCNIEEGHCNQVWMCSDKRHISCFSDAIDLWGCRTNYAPTKSRPAPLMLVQGSSETVRLDVGRLVLVKTAPQMGKLPSPLEGLSAEDSWSFWRLERRGDQRGVFVERLTFRSPAERAVALGLWPFIRPRFREIRLPGEGTSVMTGNSLPLTPICQVQWYIADRYQGLITSVPVRARRRYRSFPLGTILYPSSLRKPQPQPNCLTSFDASGMWKMRNSCVLGGLSQCFVFQILRMDQLEHGVAEQIRILAVVEPPRHFVKVGRQMLRRDSVPRSHDSALEQRERRFYGVRVNIAANIFLRLVRHSLVLVSGDSDTLQGEWVGHKLIRHNHIDIAAHVLFDVLRQSARLCVLGVKESQIAAALPNADDNLFRFLPSIDAPPDLLSANIGFVYFYLAVEFLKWWLLSHCVPDAVTQIPRCPVVDSQHPLKLVCRHALARLAKQVHSKKPLRQFQMGIVEDRARSHGELVTA